RRGSVNWTSRPPCAAEAVGPRAPPAPRLGAPRAARRRPPRRNKNMRHYDVQIVGGAVRHAYKTGLGSIAEMVTGEGKTLVATLPAYLNALEQKGVHVITVNDYLARRDCEWMLPIYNALGVTAAYIQSDMEPEARRHAY